VTFGVGLMNTGDIDFAGSVNADNNRSKSIYAKLD
jgi:hypothetical protein